MAVPRRAQIQRGPSVSRVAGAGELAAVPGLHPAVLSHRGLPGVPEPHTAAPSASISIMISATCGSMTSCPSGGGDLVGFTTTVPGSACFQGLIDGGAV